MANEARCRTVAVMLAAGSLAWTACAAGGGGDTDDGDGGQQAAYNFNEANMRYAAGAAARAIDAFPHLADLLDATLASLWQAGAAQAGQPVPLSACVEGSASFLWTDANGDGAWSAGDRVVVAPRDCRVHLGDAEVLTGDAGLTFTTVSRGPPRAIAAVFEPSLGVYGDGPAGTIRGRAEVTASSPDGARHSFAFLPSGTSLLSITGDASFDLACFDVRHLYDPAFGLVRRVAILGNLRTLGKVMSFAPGSSVAYGTGDRPASGAVELLSFMEQPSCPALGVTDGVGDSDGSTLALSPGADGEVRLELHRPRQPVHPDSCGWTDLLHPVAPQQGLIDASNALAVASAAVTALSLPRDVGALATDLVLGAYRGSPVSLCTSGGYSVSPPPTLAAGEQVTIGFTACATAALGTEVRLDGSAAVTVVSAGGSPAGDTYALTLHLAPLDVTTSASGEASHVTGAVRFSRTSTAGDVVEQSRASPEEALVLRETTGAATTERRITGFSVSSSSSAAGGFTLAARDDAATVATGALAGDLSVTVSAAIRGDGQEAPGAGAMKIAASDATSLTLTVGAGGAVAIGLDGDGDGSVDATIQTTWSELR